jgi:hypothetical protein
MKRISLEIKTETYWHTRIWYMDAGQPRRNQVSRDPKIGPALIDSQVFGEETNSYYYLLGRPVRKPE